MDNSNKLEDLKNRRNIYLSRLKQKRLDLGEADGAMHSRYPSGRVELEDDIQVLEISLSEIQKEIEKLENSRK